MPNARREAANRVGLQRRWHMRHQYTRPPPLEKPGHRLPKPSHQFFSKLFFVPRRRPRTIKPQDPPQFDQGGPPVFKALTPFFSKFPPVSRIRANFWCGGPGSTPYLSRWAKPLPAHFTLVGPRSTFLTNFYPSQSRSLKPHRALCPPASPGSFHPTPNLNYKAFSHTHFHGLAI